MSELLLCYLEELADSKVDGDQFVYGEKTAYTECLEVIQYYWSQAKRHGLDFNIEGRYPLM